MLAALSRKYIAWGRPALDRAEIQKLIRAPTRYCRPSTSYRNGLTP